jgi:hypothetical protein
VSDLIVAAPAAGWYPDPIADAQLRWWNGEGWTERTMAPQAEPSEPGTAAAAIAAPAVVASAPADGGIPSRRQVHARLGDGDTAAAAELPLPYTEVDYAAARQAYAPEPAPTPDAAPAFDWRQTPLVPRDSALGYSAAVDHSTQWHPTRTATAGAWGLAFLPWIATALVAGGAFATGYAPVAPYVPVVVALIILLLTVALALRDKRRLLDLGHDRPASEWWVLLSPPLAYLIARTVSVHRNAGKGAAPLVVYLVNSVLVVAAAIAAAILLPVLVGSGL